jgi:hypothetical protein
MKFGGFEENNEKTMTEIMLYLKKHVSNRYELFFVH